MPYPDPDNPADPASGQQQFSFLANAPAGNPASYQSLLMRRKIAEALLSKRDRLPYPKNLGEGLAYASEKLSDAFSDRIDQQKLDAAEKVQGDREAQMLKWINDAKDTTTPPADTTPTPVPPALQTPTPSPSVTNLKTTPTTPPPLGAGPGSVLNPTPLEQQRPFPAPSVPSASTTAGYNPSQATPDMLSPQLGAGGITPSALQTPPGTASTANYNPSQVTPDMFTPSPMPQQTSPVSFGATFGAIGRQSPSPPPTPGQPPPPPTPMAPVSIAGLGGTAGMGQAPGGTSLGLPTGAFTPLPTSPPPPIQMAGGGGGPGGPTTPPAPPPGPLGAPSLLSPTPVTPPSSFIPPGSAGYNGNPAIVTDIKVRPQPQPQQPLPAPQPQQPPPGVRQAGGQPLAPSGVQQAGGMVPRESVAQEGVPAPYPIELPPHPGAAPKPPLIPTDTMRMKQLQYLAGQGNLSVSPQTAKAAEVQYNALKELQNRKFAQETSDYDFNRGQYPVKLERFESAVREMPDKLVKQQVDRTQLALNQANLAKSPEEFKELVLKNTKLRQELRYKAPDNIKFENGKVGQWDGEKWVDITPQVNPLEIEIPEGTGKRLEYFVTARNISNHLNGDAKSLANLGDALATRKLGTAGNYIIDPKYQVDYTRAKLWGMSVLRSDSGANLPPKEIEETMTDYWPVPGDKPETVAAKNQARQSKETAMYLSLGKARPVADFYSERNTDLPEGTILKDPSGMPKRIVKNGLMMDIENAK